MVRVRDPRRVDCLCDSLSVSTEPADGKLIATMRGSDVRLCFAHAQMTFRDVASRRVIDSIDSSAMQRLYPLNAIGRIADGKLSAERCCDGGGYENGKIHHDG